jgi:hypothetical protein
MGKLALTKIRSWMIEEFSSTNILKIYLEKT